MKEYTDKEFLELSYDEFSKVFDAYENRRWNNLLFEDCGIFYASTPSFYEAATFLANVIYDVVFKKSNKFKNKYKLAVMNNTSKQTNLVIDNLRMITYDLDIEWLKNLNLYLYISNKDRKTDFNRYVPTDPMIVTNTTVRYYSFSSNGLSLKDKKTLSLDNYMFIENDKRQIIPLIAADDKLIQASIYLYVNTNEEFDKKHITYLLLHEISHLADIWFKKRDQSYINRDKAEMVRVSTANLSGEQQNTIQTLFSYKDNYITKKKALNLIDYQCLKCIMNLWIESLNSSEMRARLSNFIYDLSKHNSDELRMKSISDSLSPEKLCKLSETYDMYYSLYSTLRLLLDIPVKLKQLFAENDIKYHYSKKQEPLNSQTAEETYLRPYNQNFSNNSKYDEKSFDKYVNFHIKNIYNIFLKNAYKIYDSIINTTGSSANFYSELRDNGIYPENFEPYTHNYKSFHLKIN